MSGIGTGFEARGSGSRDEDVVAVSNGPVVRVIFLERVFRAVVLFWL